MEQFTAAYKLDMQVDAFAETFARHDGGEIQIRITGKTPVRGFYINVEAFPVQMISELFTLV